MYRIYKSALSAGPVLDTNRSGRGGPVLDTNRPGRAGPRKLRACRCKALFLVSLNLPI